MEENSTSEPISASTITKDKSLISEGEEDKISRDKFDSEKIISFSNVGGGDSVSGRSGVGGVSIRFSDQRSDSKKDEGLLSSPSGSSQECLQSQLAAVKLKLEQKRKKIEDDKRRMEVLMNRQREKVGQEAFLRAVAKGMEKPGLSKEAEGVSEHKPFILNQPGSRSQVGTPDVEKNVLDLYQIQRGLQRMSTQQAQSPHREPFFINQQQQQPVQVQSQTVQQQQQPPQPPSVHPYFMYPPSHPPWFGMVPYPHHPYFPQTYPPPQGPTPSQPTDQQHHHYPQQQLNSPSQNNSPPIVVQADKPTPLTDKPSLSSSFLEMKRKQCQTETRPQAVTPVPSCHSTPVKQSLSSSFLRAKQQQQSVLLSPRRSQGHDNQSVSPRRELSPAGSRCQDVTDHVVVDASPPLVMTQSTLETLNSMTTESIKEDSNSKGFVISFGEETPVKPKPVLKPRQQSLTKDPALSTKDSSVCESPVSTKASLKASSVRECDSRVTLCLVCSVRDVDTDNLCSLCSQMLIKINDVASPETYKGCERQCSFEGDSFTSWCVACWRIAAKTSGVLRESEEETQRQKEWVEMMSEKRRQQAEESRLKREEEAARRRQEEMMKKEELMRKKDEEKKRREAILEAYKLKKEADKLKEEGMNFYSSKPPPKLRPKSAGGNRLRPRPNTIHVDNREDDVTGSHNNIYRSMSRGDSSYRRGSNVSLHDGGSGWSGSGSSDIRSLSMFSRSKSSSASNLGPSSLQLGMRGRGSSRHEDDNCSEVSSTTSGYTSGRGSARLYREPVSKTNRPIILNAVEYVVLPGEVNKETRIRVMEEIEKCDCPHFLILFRDSKLQFRALYAYYPDTEEVFKIHGIGPRQVTDKMMDLYFKYNSGGKKFTQIHTKHLTATIDAFTIHNQLWLGKKTRLPDKDMAMVV